MQAYASVRTKPVDDFITKAGYQHESEYVELDRQYDIDSEFYFIIRNGHYSDVQMVCLFRRGVTNVWAFTDDQPHDLLLTKSERSGRKLSRIKADVQEWINDYDRKRR